MYMAYIATHHCVDTYASVDERQSDDCVSIPSSQVERGEVRSLKLKNLWSSGDEEVYGV